MGPKSLKELTAIVAKIHQAGCKFILKGIMTVADAKAAVAAGADCIVVSNHGGGSWNTRRVRHGCCPPLPAAVKGQITVMVDGGVRSGADVFKMLALGADLSGIGRPIVWAAIGGRRGRREQIPDPAQRRTGADYGPHGLPGHCRHHWGRPVRATLTDCTKKLTHPGKAEPCNASCFPA